jgi:fumarylacetoacetase
MTLFGLDNLPYGVFSPASGAPRVGVRLGDDVVDLSVLFDDPVFATPSLNAFMAQGRARWTQVREQITRLLAGAVPDAAVHPVDDVRMHLPVEVADYVDFYASEHHASNLGRLFRPDSEPLMPNWKHLPVGYHGRAGTVVVSGTDVVRPSGQRKAPDEAAPTYGPSRRLDIEAELGFVVGAGSTLGDRIGVDEFADHVFGAVLVNDWSARDIQAWEYVPLGPHLGKSFATSISPWVVTLNELDRVAGEPQEPPPLDYLRIEPFAFDVPLEIELNGEVISRTNARHLYWNVAQQIAHLTSNGSTLRTGDLLATGTISGPGERERGSLIELTWNEGPFLADGDEVVLRGEGLGEVWGRIAPSA